MSEELKQYNTALQYYQQSQALADTVTNRGLIMANAYRMSDIYLKQNNPSRALEYYMLASRYEDSINVHKQGVQIAAITQNHEIEKKETEIERLEAEKQSRNAYILLQEEKIQQQQTILLLAMFSFLTGISVVALIFRNIKARRKAAKKLEEQEKETLQAIYERNLAQADMLASRLQMNPHFTFNSLNAINNLVQQQKNDLASTYLIAFSRFVRLVLETSQKHVVSLEEELDMLDRYLQLEKKRFDDQFVFHLEIIEKCCLRNFQVPPLLLQPIAENAIWHGLMPSKKEIKELRVTVEKIPDGVSVRLTDNGVGRHAGTKKPGHTSMGGNLTQERIDLYNQSYESEIECTITDLMEEGLPAGTSVEIKILHPDNTLQPNSTKPPYHG